MKNGELLIFSDYMTSRLEPSWYNSIAQYRYMNDGNIPLHCQYRKRKKSCKENLIVIGEHDVQWYKYNRLNNSNLSMITRKIVPNDVRYIYIMNPSRIREYFIGFNEIEVYENACKRSKVGNIEATKVSTEYDRFYSDFSNPRVDQINSEDRSNPGLIYDLVMTLFSNEHYQIDRNGNRLEGGMDLLDIADYGINFSDFMVPERYAEITKREKIIPWERKSFDGFCEVPFISTNIYTLPAD